MQVSELTARDLIVRAMGLLPTDGTAFRALVAALDALVGEEEYDEDPTAGFLIPQDGHGEAF